MSYFERILALTAFVTAYALAPEVAPKLLAPQETRNSAAHSSEHTPHAPRNLKEN